MPLDLGWFKEELESKLDDYSLLVWILIAICVLLVGSVTVPYIVADNPSNQEKLPTTSYDVYDESSSDFPTENDSSRHINIKYSGEIDTTYMLTAWVDKDKGMMTYVGTYIHEEKYKTNLYDVDGYTNYSTSSRHVTYEQVTAYTNDSPQGDRFKAKSENECTMENGSTLVTKRTDDDAVTDMPSVEGTNPLDSGPDTDRVLNFRKHDSEYTVNKGMFINSNGDLVRVENSTGSIEARNNQIYSSDLKTEAVMYKQIEVLGTDMPMINPATRQEFTVDYNVETVTSGVGINLTKPPNIEGCLKTD